MKICKKCKIEKDINEFAKSQFVITNGKCKSCQKKFRFLKKKEIDEYNRRYYQDHKDQLDIQHKEYYQENKSYLLECQKNYLQENKDAREAKKEYNKKYGKEYNNEYCKFRFKNDPAFRLRKIISASIWSAIKRNGARKNGSCLRYLSYSIDELKYYIEKQFESWMNWNNQGKYDPKTWDDNDLSTWKWQLDHIIPQIDLPYASMEDDNFNKCWALENLRPLSAKQNIIDGDRK